MHAKFLLWASIDPYSVHWTSWLTLTRIIVWLLSIQMQIFVLYISTVSRIFGFLATWHTYFCQDSKCFFGVFSACSKKHRKEVSGDLHINLVVHSPGKERLFVTSSYWCVSVFFLDILSFLIVWLHQQLKDIHLQWIMYAFQR